MGLELAETATGELAQLTRGYINLASLLEAKGELARCYDVAAEVHRLAQRRGHRAAIRFSQGNLIEGTLATGDWEEAELRATEFLDELGRAGAHFFDTTALVAKAMIALARDERNQARAHIEHATPLARKVKDPQIVVPILSAAALFYAELGERSRARALLEEIEPGAHVATVPAAFFAAATIDYADVWRRRTAEWRAATPPQRCERLAVSKPVARQLLGAEGPGFGISDSLAPA